MGGLNYMRNLLSAVVGNPTRRLEPVLITPTAQSDTILEGFPELPVVRTSLVQYGTFARRIGQTCRRLAQRDFTLEWMMRQHDLDVLSHSFPTGRRSTRISVNWIPDFQHIRMPELFSEAERRSRDGYFRRLIHGSRRIILSSFDAQRDFERFCPSQAHKGRVLHFASSFDNVSAVPTWEEARARLNIDRPYFLLPNQFWKHKNHRVVIEAVGILRRRGIDTLVLATGSPNDYRHPDHFSRLMTRIRELRVESDFRVLGMVGLPDLQMLMLNAIALINPSEFEGWSTTVEESKSLGVPILLSDIPVHREQAPPLGRYFDAHSAVDLADAIAAALKEDDPTAAQQHRVAAARDLPARMHSFARAYEDIVLESTTGHPFEP